MKKCVFKNLGSDLKKVAFNLKMKMFIKQKLSSVFYQSCKRWFFFIPKFC